MTAIHVRDWTCEPAVALPEDTPLPCLSDGSCCLWGRLWDCAHALVPTPAMEAWLASRGVGVATAYQLGCRDLAPVLPELRRIIRDTPPEVAEAAGVLRSTGDADRLELWHPLRGEPWAAGLAIPVWHPECSAPVGWRWRLYQPLRSGAKVLGMFGGGPRLPLGLRLPYRTASNVVGLPYSRATIIVEGEPDWLSVAECAGTRAAVVGLVNASSGWRAEWTPFLDGCSRVVALVHDAHSDKVAGTLARALRDRHGTAEATRRYRRLTLFEDRDANDLHREGRLCALVEACLGEVEA
ncbi:MAG: hypothetical protein ACQEXJ_02765 [Myxococcota bacterium]